MDITAAHDSRAGEYIEQLGTLEQMAAQDRRTISSWRDAVAGRILDAGCGPGHWSDLLAAGRACDVVAVDASARFLRSARQRFPHVPFVLADLGALPIAKLPQILMRLAVGGKLRRADLDEIKAANKDGQIVFAENERPHVARSNGRVYRGGTRRCDPS